MHTQQDVWEGMGNTGILKAVCESQVFRTQPSVPQTVVKELEELLNSAAVVLEYMAHDEYIKEEEENNSSANFQRAYL